jgi:hypothetical protein
LAAVVLFVTILAVVPTVRAQQASDQDSAQQPSQPQQRTDSQQSSSQEPSPEESTSRRGARPRDYKTWTFNVGGGGGLTSGTTRTFARSGGGIASAGIARNYSKYFGFRLDVQWDNLPLRNSALQQAQAPGGNAHVYSVMLDPIINIPATKQWSGYILLGPSYYHRSGKLDSSSAIPGTGCNPFWAWWGACYTGSSLRSDGKFLRSSLNEYGENFGAGVARKISPKVDVYAEFRFLHGTHKGITTDLRPITIGLRW